MLSSHPVFCLKWVDNPAGLEYDVAMSQPLHIGELMTINSELLEILVCPACREKVEQKGEFIVCSSCGRRYPIRDEIPIMLINEALSPEEAEQQN
jgi:hypothetical protein